MRSLKQELYERRRSFRTFVFAPLFELQKSGIDKISSPVFNWGGVQFDFKPARLMSISVQFDVKRYKGVGYL